MTLSQPHKWLAGTTIAMAGLTAFHGCKKQPSGVSTPAYIIGSNDIIPVDKNVAKKVDPDVLKASVLVATQLENKRVKFCSGTLIDPETDDGNLRVLTNHHCFAETDSDGKAIRAILGEACVNTHVYFGFSPKAGTKTTGTTCQGGSLRTNYDGDLAVFTLASNPPADYHAVKIWGGADIPTGRSALIIHYPDVEDQLALPPDGNIKLPTEEATLNNCTVIGGFDVSEWDLDRTLPFSLRHTCDLIHGSSGSGLIDRETGQLLGVNWGGIKISYADGERTDNVATRASYVTAFLNFTTEQVIHNAESQRSANTLAATDSAGPLQKKSENVAEKIKKGCGAVALVENPAQSQLTILAMLFLFFIPVAPAMFTGILLRKSRERQR